MKKQYFKLLMIILISTILYLIYKIYQEEIHVWSCESEKNRASCTVVGLLNEQRLNPVRAKKFYRLSCDQDYALGCHHLGLMLKKNDKEQEAFEVFEKACDMQLEMSCLMIGRQKDAP